MKALMKGGIDISVDYENPQPCKFRREVVGIRSNSCIHITSVSLKVRER
jgi:hypothetical protein